MNNMFLAKTNPRETIIEHTEALVERLERLKEIYPQIENLNWELLELAAIYHDLGKMNTKFQNKLYEKLGEDTLEDNIGNAKEIPHGYLSAAFIARKSIEAKYGKELLKILYQCVYYHHNREKLENSDPIKLTVEEDLNLYWDEFEYERLDKSEKLYPSYIKYVKRRIGPDHEHYEKYVMTKGVLNKLDYAASAHIDVEVENDRLFEKTMDYLQKDGYQPNELQRYMMENQDKNNIVIASTGIGKTEASLFWIGNSKGFFSLPLRVSINAIYDRIKSKIDFNDVALLHSDTYSEYLKRDKNLEADYFEKIKQFSMPVTVCTLDQLIDFVFKCEGYELKMATLGYSKLVIDEIQMYSPEMLGFLIVALKNITRIGGKFSIVTATMPPIIIDFLRREKIKFNDPVTYHKKVDGKIQLRHRAKTISGQIDACEICKSYEDKKVLVICNTVKKAQAVYEEIKKWLRGKDVEINLLHSKFIKRDRAQKEMDILELGDKNNGRTGIWVTTQVVEASLDIDFDVLYTELSDISGLLQRMGRVYRSRTLENEDTNIYIYDGGDKPTSGIGNTEKSIIDIDIFNLSKDAVKHFDGTEIDEGMKMKLVESVYTKEKLERSNYYKRIKDTIDWTSQIEEYELEKKSVKLRDILSFPIIPKSVYESNYDGIQQSKEKIESMKKTLKRAGNESSQIRKQIQMEKDNIKSFTVDIALYQYENARRENLICEKIEMDRFNNILIVDYEYGVEKGLVAGKEENGKVENQFI